MTEIFDLFLLIFGAGLVAYIGTYLAVWLYTQGQD